MRRIDLYFREFMLICMQRTDQEKEKKKIAKRIAECWNLTQWRRLSLRDRGGGSGYGNNYVEFEQ